MIDRRAEVVGRLKALEDGAAPLIGFLQNPHAVQELRADKQYNLQMLNERYQVVASSTFRRFDAVILIFLLLRQRRIKN